MSDPAFDSLVAHAKTRAVALLRDDRISLDDGRFVLRAIEDLEADGSGLFTADVGRGVARYIEARVGPALAHQLELVPTLHPEVCR